MSKHFDLVVIGGGLSGMLTAAFAAKQGEQCALITKGSGTLTIGSGTIDVLGYSPEGMPLQNPFDGFLSLYETHPYRLIGEKIVRNAFTSFCKLLEEKIPYYAPSENNSLLITSAGTIKPTWLVPQSMDMSIINSAQNICILGIEGFKDFYPELIVKNLSTKKAFQSKHLTHKMLTSPISLQHRDLLSTDLARYVETEEGTNWLIQQIQNIGPYDLLIIPPLLGLKNPLPLLTKIELATSTAIREAVIQPPSVTGLRLHTALLQILKKYSVTVINNSAVKRTCTQGNSCLAVETEQDGATYTYKGNHFVIATGGILSEGMQSTPHKTWEPILNIEDSTTASTHGWAQPELYPTPTKTHAFLSLGANVDASLRPIDSAHKPIYNNVYFVGHALKNYDPSNEKSGNGVAVATAYRAALNIDVGVFS